MCPAKTQGFHTPNAFLYTGRQLAWVSPLLQSLNMLTCCFEFKKAMGWKEKLSMWINPNTSALTRVRTRDLGKERET